MTWLTYITAAFFEIAGCFAFWSWLRNDKPAVWLLPGIACLIAPSGGYEHRYPVDCWRFYPDGMRALARFARLECLEAYTQWEGSDDPGSDPWKDTVLVLRKPQRPWPKALAVRGLQALQHRLLGFRLID